MGKTVRLNEQQIKKLILLEKLSISDEVIFATDSLIQQLERELREILQTSNVKEKYSNTFLFRCFGITFRVEYTVFFTNVESVQQVQSIDLDNRIIKLTFIYTNELFDNETFYDGIAHELTHAFQKSKREKSLSDEVYKKVMEVALNKDNEYSNEVSMLAKGLYFTQQIEQDAYIHGLYNQSKEILRNYNHITNKLINNVVLDTQFARLPYFINKIKQVVSDNDKAFDQMIELGIFKKSKRKTSNNYLKRLYLETMNKTLARITRKIKNVIKRLEYDFLQ